MRGKTHGVVATGDPQTTAAGAAAFEGGGNAIDAVVAAAFAAFVCELPLCSPLGGAVALVRPLGREAFALDAFARTPGYGQTPETLDFDHVEVDFGAARQVFHVGRGSAAVPLAVRGLLKLHARFGVLPLSNLLEPAVELGRRGFVVGPGVSFALGLLQPIFDRTVQAAERVRVDGRIALQGDRLDNPDLAATLEALGRDPGVVAALEADLVRHHGPSEGGCITAEDVARAALHELVPVRLRHAGAALWSMPGPSTGGVLVALGAKLLEGKRHAPVLGPEHVLELLNVQRTLLGVRDGDFDDRCRDAAFVAELLSGPSIERLRQGAAHAHPDVLLGSTTHISAIDAQGTLVAITLTNGEGSGHVLPGTGIMVNNLMGEEDIHPRGFHRDPPGRPLATMMAPTLRLAPNGDALALGSGGSNRLRNAILQVLSLVVDQGLPLDEAVAAPRLHAEQSAEGLRIAFELPDLDSDAEAVLRQVPSAACVGFAERNMYFGGVHAAACENGNLFGAGDPRRGGSVKVV